MPDNALAGYDIVQPNVDLFKPMQSLAQLQMAQAHSQLYGAQARFQITKQNALAEAYRRKQTGDPSWYEPIAMVDPDTAKHAQEFDRTEREIQAGPAAAKDIFSNNPDQRASGLATLGGIRPEAGLAAAHGVNFQQEATSKELNTHFQMLGSVASRYLDVYKQWKNGQATDKDHLDAWHTALSEAYKAKIPGLDANYINMNWDKPDPAMAQSYMKAADALKQRQLEAEGAQHRQTQAAKPDKIRPGEETIVAPKDVGATTGDEPDLPQKQPPQPGVMPPGAAPEAATKPATFATEKGQVASDLPPTPIPQRPLTQKMPGALMAAATPQDLELAKAAGKEYIDKLGPQGQAALGQRNDLNTMETVIRSGNTKTGAFGQARTAMAAYVYEIFGRGKDGENAVKRLVGIDLADQTLLEKKTTQMGLQYARATEGAREAVQAIRIALGANPSTANTPEANLKIIAVMKAANQWVIDRMLYADKFQQQNKHYVGASAQFDRERPPEVYTSRVEPFHVPRLEDSPKPDPNRMVNGVRYTYQDKTGATATKYWMAIPDHPQGGKFVDRLQ